MRILGIESSCDETAAAVVDVDAGKPEIKSNIVASQIATHKKFGGVVPEIASREHCKVISQIVKAALSDAGAGIDSIDAVAVTFAPGLIGPLLVGVCYAKGLASVIGKPLIPVDHIKAHVAAAHLENDFDCGSYLALVVSGGHTSLYNVSKDYIFDEIGSTRDDACGEAFDKIGRLIGLPYPGGAAMDRLAAEAFKADLVKLKDDVQFPSPALNDNTYDFSFSGLKTAAINYINTRKQKTRKDVLDDEEVRMIAGEFTRTVCDGISIKLSKAISEYRPEALVLAGGVAANTHLRKAVSEVCEKHKVKLYMPSISLCGDNGAMTAMAGYYLYINNIVADSYLNAFASDEDSAQYYECLIGPGT